MDLHKNLRRTCVIAVLFALHGTALAESVPAALREAALKAVGTNPEVQARWHAFQAAGAEQDVARGGYLPQIDLNAGVGRERQDLPGEATERYTRRGAALSLNQMLYDGFLTRSEVSRLGFARLARYYEVVDASETAALETVREPDAHLAEAFDDPGGVACGEPPGLVGQVADARVETPPRRGAVAVLHGGAGEQLPAGAVELRLQLRVPGEVELLEPVDEVHEPVERLLVDAALRLAHGDEHLLAEHGGLLAQARHRVAHEGVDALGDLGRRALGRLPPGFDDGLPVALGDELRLQALRHPDLEEARLKPK